MRLSRDAHARIGASCHRYLSFSRLVPNSSREFCGQTKDCFEDVGHLQNKLIGISDNDALLRIIQEEKAVPLTCVVREGRAQPRIRKVGY